MRLSTKGRYGLKSMFELALNYGEGPVPLNQIAEKQNLSIHYLEQLFASLRKAGLVQSVRGAQGGYMLAFKPKEITVGSIIRTLEGPLVPADCVSDEDTNECEKAEYCVTRIIWEKMRDSINSVVDSITLQDMLDDYKRLQNKNSYMYYI